MGPGAVFAAPPSPRARIRWPVGLADALRVAQFLTPTAQSSAPPKPVAWATTLIPPCPNSSASLAAQRRRPRSIQLRRKGG